MNEKSNLKSFYSDEIITDETKSAILEYINDNTEHSTLLVTFKEVFKPILKGIGQLVQDCLMSILGMLKTLLFLLKPAKLEFCPSWNQSKFTLNSAF